MDRQPISPEAYSKLVSEMTPPSRHLRGCVRAFWVGGVICCIGQALNLLGEALELSEMTAPMFTSVVLIFLGTTLTGIGVYDQIGRYAGAGSIVPITGFANSVAAPAIEYRREGMVMGVGARIFQLAGPVLAYGITSSMLVGIIYWIARMWFL
ncbi:MAG: stage V sporulation protein AC [Aristaeellaceae bacterium]|nr:stage V sporulation protein AC [Eubacteriales bacterium]